MTTASMPASTTLARRLSSKAAHGALAISAALLGSSAFAQQYTYVDGSFTLTTTADVNVMFDLLLASGHPLPGSTSTFQETLTPDLIPADNPDSFYPGFSITQAVTSTAINGASVSTAKATGSGFAQQRTFGTRAWSSQFQNLELDLQNSAVYADIYTAQGTYLHQLLLVPGSGIRWTTYDGTPFTTQTLGTPGMVSPTLEADGYYHAKGSIINMVLDGDYNKTTRATTGALHIVNSGLGVTGVSGMAFDNVPYMTVDVDLRFAVPEPSTYALMLAGLTSMATLAYRRRKSSVHRAS